MKKSYTLAEVLEAIQNVDRIMAEYEAKQNQDDNDFRI